MKNWMIALAVVGALSLSSALAQDSNRPVRTNPIQTGVRLKEVAPVYPPVARAAKISGDVLLHVIINADGTVRSLEPISGHPMLVPAAVQAVRQWVYKPYLLNGKPTAVDTTVTVHFSLETSPLPAPEKK